MCAVVTQEFLNFTRSKGNDLSTPAPMYGFPGLKHGDRWCLCAGRYVFTHNTIVTRARILGGLVRLVCDAEVGRWALQRTNIRGRPYTGSVPCCLGNGCGTTVRHFTHVEQSGGRGRGGGMMSAHGQHPNQRRGTGTTTRTQVGRSKEGWGGAARSAGGHQRNGTRRRIAGRTEAVRGRCHADVQLSRLHSDLSVLHGRSVDAHAPTEGLWCGAAAARLGCSRASFAELGALHAMLAQQLRDHLEEDLGGGV